MAYDNSTYSPFFQSSSDALQRLNKTIPKKTAVNNKYPNISSTVSNFKLGQVTTPYGGSTKFESYHPGIDIANQPGSPIPAWSGGMVKEVVTGRKQGTPGFGNYVVVQDDQGNIWRYSHLADSYVQVGQPIQRGQVLGGMGNTGSTYSTSGGTGTHLDIRVMNAFKKYLNPTSFLNKRV